MIDTYFDENSERNYTNTITWSELLPSINPYDFNIKTFKVMIEEIA